MADASLPPARAAAKAAPGREPSSRARPGASTISLLYPRTLARRVTCGQCGFMLMSDRSLKLQMHLGDIHRGARTVEGYEPLVQETSHGQIEMRYYPSPGTACGTIFVGGAGGGFDTPVRGWLYPRLCEQLSDEDAIASLRVRYRKHNELKECVLDVLAGISFLETEGIAAVALIGHSFGGAVVIQAAANAPIVRTCVALSTQTYGTEPAAELGPRCSLLLVHGTDDEVLPSACSRAVYRAARQHL